MANARYQHPSTFASSIQAVTVEQSYVSYSTLLHEMEEAGVELTPSQDKVWALAEEHMRMGHPYAAHKVITDLIDQITAPSEPSAEGRGASPTSPTERSESDGE